jgi:hypothetical protein
MVLLTRVIFLSFWLILFQKHVSPDQPDGPIADDAVISDQLISTELTK